MKAIDFPQANLTLRAGGNSQTIALRIALCEQKSQPGADFYVSKWELEDYEKDAYRETIRLAIHAVDQNSSMTPQQKENQLLNKMMGLLPKIFLAAMHTPPPVMMLAASPVEEPYPFIDDFLRPLNDRAAQLNKLNNHPEEN